MYDEDEVSDMIGKTFTSVIQQNEEILFEGDTSFRMFHMDDCCEHVYIEDICGDLRDLVGTPILHAEESVGQTKPQFDDVMGTFHALQTDFNTDPNSDDSWTWTFYKFATIKGSVSIRWFGTSNGYYSESVNVHEIKREPVQEHQLNSWKLK